MLPRFRLTAADSAIDGSLRIALDTGLIRGSITGRAPDLARLVQARRHTARRQPRVRRRARRARRPAGRSLANRNPAHRRHRISRIGIGRLALTARFADILRAPSGTGRLSLTSASFGASEFATATLTLDAPRPGRFVFQGDAKGQPLTVALAGDGGLEPGRAELRLTRLAGSLGSDRILLEQPLTLSKRGADLAFSGLALDFGDRSDHRQRRRAGRVAVARAECRQFADRVGGAPRWATAMCEAP